ncbi:unnamed protein product [Durusdinium trenchii]|uniref:Uncharacterized protein n=1 Tax=Durusdinium trenchii TaxID=1381693 RepID=A0ABP0R5F9_9DINO
MQGMKPWELGGSSCWEAGLHPVLCCLGALWEVPQEKIDLCWTDGRSFESCCLTERMLHTMEIRSWKYELPTCGCHVSDLRMKHAFCQLQDMLKPLDHPHCLAQLGVHPGSYHRICA